MSTEKKRIEDAVQVCMAKPLSLAVCGAWLACKFVGKASANLTRHVRRRLPKRLTRSH